MLPISSYFSNINKRNRLIYLISSKKINLVINWRYAQNVEPQTVKIKTDFIKNI